MRIKYILIILNLFFILNYSFASDSMSSGASSQQYKAILNKKLELKKIYLDKVEEYKLATGKNKENVKQEIEAIIKQVKGINVQIQQLKQDCAVSSLTQLREKIKVAEQSIASINKQIADLKAWAHKVGAMSRIATVNVCAWCGTRYPARCTQCPRCHRTSVSRVWSGKKSDVDKEISEIHKKMKVLYEKLLDKKFLLSYYKNQLVNATKLAQQPGK